MSITDSLAAYCASLDYEDVPPETREKTKQVLLDTIGIAIGSQRAKSTPAVLETVTALDDDGGAATTLADGGGQSPAYATLVNATLAHSLDFDETHREGSVHAAAPVLGGALTVGEEVDATGRELLTAFVAGYEVTARLGMALNSEAHYAKGFHATSTCGVYGATAAASVLQGADKETTATAFGINGSQASGSLQFLENGSWNKRIHPGLAAHSGYMATQFAQQAFFAADEAIEGPRGFLQAYSDAPRPDAALRGLGERFEIDQTGLKPYPLCRFMHPAIDGLVEIVTANDIDSAAISSIDIGMSTSGQNIVGDPEHAYPESTVDAQFSMPFGAMLAVSRRKAGVNELFDALTGAFTTEEKRLMDATTTSVADWANDLYPDKWAVGVRIDADKTYERRITDARGDPRNPLTWKEIRSKYEALVVPVVGEGTAETLRQRVESIEEHTVESLLNPLRITDFRNPV